MSASGDLASHLGASDGPGLVGYNAFFNKNKIKLTDTINLDEKLSEVASVADTSDGGRNIPGSPALSASARATSPINNFEIPLTDPYDKLRTSTGRNDDVRSVRSHRSTHSHRSHRSHRSSKLQVDGLHNPFTEERPTSPVDKPSDIPEPVHDEYYKNDERGSVYRESTHRNDEDSRRNDDGPRRNDDGHSILPPTDYERDTTAERLLEYQLSKKREKLLGQARKMERKYGIRFNKQITDDMPLHELENEINLAKRDRKIERNVAFAKHTMLWVTKAAEWASSYTPIDLDGWSGELRRDMAEIGEILEELHEEHEEVIDKFSNPWTKLALIWFGGGARVASSNVGPKVMGKMLRKRRATGEEKRQEEEKAEIAEAVDQDMMNLLQELEETP